MISHEVITEDSWSVGDDLYIIGRVYKVKKKRLMWKPRLPMSFIDTSKTLRGFLVRKRTIPTERPQPAGEISANFSW
jgi:hypothetical protein